MTLALSRPRVPLALLLAMTAFLALAALTSAKSPADFADTCFGLGPGTELIEVTAADGTVLQSACYDNTGHEAFSCDWVKNTCPAILGEPRDGLGQVPTDGVLDDPSGPEQSGVGGVAAPPRGGGAVLSTGQ